MTSIDDRESMEFDVLIVGGGPAGLACACKLAQLAQEQQTPVNIAVLEKGSEIGAHIISGALLETRALQELFADWQQRGAPVTTKVTSEDVCYLHSARASVRIPALLVPAELHNDNNYIISLGNFCRWLATQAEALGIEILTGFSGSELLKNEQGEVTGVLTGDMGIDKHGEQTSAYTPGYALYAKYTVLAEGCRGNLGKQVIKDFALDRDSTPQHYALGIKEIWEVSARAAKPGHVVHSLGWPLQDSGTSGGGFMYQMENNQVAIGLITDLNYANPWLNPYEEFQRMKHHPLFAAVLADGKRLNYGARALVKGGLQALPRLVFPGGLLIGDDAGVLNFLKLKGTHTAMKSGMLAASCIFEALQKPTPGLLDSYQEAFNNSWLQAELHRSRNCAPAMHKLGTLLGAAWCWIDQTLLRGKLPFTLKDQLADHDALKPADRCKRIEYPKPDNKLSFDLLSSVYLSNTFHAENQPCHLQLLDPETPIQFNLAQFDEPAQRYCPAGVYEIIREDGTPHLQINAQNCVHCKTCDIKDPTQNIRWVPPEGGGGPNYPNM